MNLMEFKVSMMASTWRYYLSLRAYKNLTISYVNGNVKYANVKSILPCLASFSSPSIIFLPNNSVRHLQSRMPKSREHARVHHGSSSTWGATKHWLHPCNTLTGSHSTNEHSTPNNEFHLHYLEHVVLEIRLEVLGLRCQQDIQNHRHATFFDWVMNNEVIK